MAKTTGIVSVVRLNSAMTAAMPGGYQGMRLIARLVPRAAGVRAYGVIDDPGRCEALRQAAENDITDAKAISEAVMRPARRSMLSPRNIAGSP